MRRHHFHDDSDQRDALNDYLDAHTGFTPAGSRADELDPDLRDGVERFLDLAERAGAIPGGHSQHRRPALNATLPASGALPAPSQTPERKRRHIAVPAWTRHLHMLSTGLLILAVAALSVAAFGPNGIGGGDGNGTGDGPGQFAAVPIATVPDNIKGSPVPFPTSDECTVAVTRDEVIEDLQAANIATHPNLPEYEIPIEASDQEVEAITQTFREWQACSWDTQGFGFAYEIQLQTPWYTANQLPIFRSANGDSLRPVSEETIEDYVDVLLKDEEAATPPAVSSTPFTFPERPDRLPIPEGGTPVTPIYGGNGRPTLFPEDIVITGPDTATATVYFVVPETGEVMVVDPQIFELVNIDGQWLLNDYIQQLG